MLSAQLAALRLSLHLLRVQQQEQQRRQIALLKFTSFSHSRTQQSKFGEKLTCDKIVQNT